MKNLKTLILFLTFILPISLIGQQITNTSGGYFETNEKSIQFTFSELLIETFQSDELIITQGFNQPNLTITSITQNEFGNISIEVYPNPVAEMLFMKIEDQINYGWKLSNINGKLLTTGETKQINKIDFTTLPQGVYFLSINDGVINQIFKIIKK